MQIELNGVPAAVPDGARLSDAVALTGRSGDVLMVLDGFQTGEDLPLTPGCRVTVLGRDERPTAETALALLCARNSPGVAEVLQGARVAVAGLGGLGSNVAIELARAGTGCLHLIDFDTVDATNLNRQHYFLQDLGKRKTEALARQIEAITPCCRVLTDPVRVTADNLAALFALDGYVCECFDRAEDKALLVNGVLEQFPETYLVAASGLAGYGSGNAVVTRRVAERFYLCGDGVSAAVPGCGLMAPRAALCASHQAHMILRLILGETAP